MIHICTYSSEQLLHFAHNHKLGVLSLDTPRLFLSFSFLFLHKSKCYYELGNLENLTVIQEVKIYLQWR